MSIKPLNDRVVIKPDEVATTTPGGIFLGASADKPSEGVVVAAGPGTTLPNGQFKAITVAVGDRVIYVKQAGVEITVDGEKCLMMFEGDIMGIIN